VPVRLIGQPGLIAFRINHMDEVSTLPRVGAHEIGWVRHATGLVGASALGKPPWLR